MSNVRETGQYVTCSVSGESYKSFVPMPLPPNPPLNMDELSDLLAEASTALGRLDGLAGFLPDVSLYIYMYIRKEAVLSSQIEGTQSTLSDLLLYENKQAPGVPVEDVQEVSNYVAGLNHGIERIRGGFPLCLRLLREIHEILLSSGRGDTKLPGEFRTSQNWIGGSRPGNARFVPPPPEQLNETLGALEKFLHEESRMPVLIKAALAHVQFETIHPFLDGNGRIGRLLITLLLCAQGVLKEPILYLSLYFKTQRSEYYDQLQRVRETGNWEEWVRFFLIGVIETAGQGVATAQSILDLFERDRARIESQNKVSPGLLKVFTDLQRRPVTSGKDVAARAELTAPTANAALKKLEEIGIIEEITGKQRDRVFAYKEYLGLLQQEAKE
jgi:Fic family protein